MAEDRAFDLGRIDIFAAGDDHVLHPVVDEEIAVRVEIARVAGANPAIVGHSRRGRIGQVPISQHIVRRARDDLATLAGRNRLADGRSVEWRLGKECVNTGKYRWASYS